jgi:hypothetical protein
MDWYNDVVYKFRQIEELKTQVRRLERGRQTLRKGVLVPASGDLAGVPRDILTRGRIDLSSSKLIGQGGRVPVGFKGKFGFSAETTSITIYWDGTNASELFSRLGDDGTAKAIAGGSITISGLTINTQYGFLPYWSPFNNCGIGWIVGDAGAPMFAFTPSAQIVLAQQQQGLYNREPMSVGFMKYSTTAAGSSSGAGTGSTCVMVGTDIETVGDSEYVSELLPQSEWIQIKSKRNPRTLYCTPNHPLYHAELGKMQAASFKVGDLIITDSGEDELEICQPHRRVCTKIHVKMPVGHLFWANGYLSHNAKAPWYPGGV